MGRAQIEENQMGLALEKVKRGKRGRSKG